MGRYKPSVRCPTCHKPPTVRFPEDAVREARLERGGKRKQTVACPRCRTVYWLRARDIATARIDDKAKRA